MKFEFTEKTKRMFKPFKLTIEVETCEEARLLYAKLAVPYDDIPSYMWVDGEVVCGSLHEKLGGGFFDTFRQQIKGENTNV